jgi:hypothetical protein
MKKNSTESEDSYLKNNILTRMRQCGVCDFSHLGCDTKTYVKYIESQFPEGTTWKDFGKVFENYSSHFISVFFSTLNI